MRIKKQRTAALLTCMVLTVVMFFFSFYVIEEANHVCSGGDCPVCACIHTAEQTLRQLGTGLAEFAGIVWAAVTAAELLSFVYLFVPCISLVSRKVRLNN